MDRVFCALLRGYVYLLRLTPPSGRVHLNSSDSPGWWHQSNSMPLASCEEPCDLRHGQMACIYLKKKKRRRNRWRRCFMHRKQHATYRAYTLLWKQEFSTLPLRLVCISSWIDHSRILCALLTDNAREQEKQNRIYSYRWRRRRSSLSEDSKCYGRVEAWGHAHVLWSWLTVCIGTATVEKITETETERQCSLTLYPPSSTNTEGHAEYAPSCTYELNDLRKRGFTLFKNERRR